MVCYIHNLGGRQWQVWREVEEFVLHLALLGMKQGREVVRWCGKVGRVRIVNVEFDDFESLSEAVVQAVGDLGSRL